MENSTASPAKIITWATNFNNKLGCDAFVHIDKAPSVNPTETQLKNSVFEIRTADASYPPVKVKCDVLHTMEFEKVNDFIAWTSHGMDAVQLSTFMFNMYQPDFSWNTKIAIYFYKKINN